MRVTLRDVTTAAVTAVVVTGYVGLVTGAAWLPEPSVRVAAAVFLLVGQPTCTLCAAEVLAAGTTRGAWSMLGPIALASALAALASGSAPVLGAAVLALVLLWLVALGSRALHGGRAVRR
jgi:hypothetical protein